LRHDAVVVADDARKQGLPGAKLSNEIVADFFADVAARHVAARHGVAKRAQGGYTGSGHGLILSGLCKRILFSRGLLRAGVASPRVRTPGRMRAWPGEYDARVRAWVGSRRRRAGTGRAPLVRRCGCRVP